jgi:hypothetical protein
MRPRRLCCRSGLNKGTSGHRWAALLGLLRIHCKWASQCSQCCLSRLGGHSSTVANAPNLYINNIYSDSDNQSIENVTVLVVTEVLLLSHLP